MVFHRHSFAFNHLDMIEYRARRLVASWLSRKNQKNRIVELHSVRMDVYLGYNNQTTQYKGA